MLESIAMLCHKRVTIGEVMGRAADETRVAIDWPRLFRRLSRRFGWTPQQIQDLTLQQALWYLEPLGGSSSRRLLPADEARALVTLLREAGRGNTKRCPVFPLSSPERGRG